MTATQAILEQFQRMKPDNMCAALATVVKVEGSAYRRPGARMLVSPDGRRLGSISGGCLEADVALRAQQVLATGQPDYVLYDTRTSNGDLLVELGCKGAVGILIERADNPEVRGSLEFLASFAQDRGEGAMATVFRVEGDCPVRVGDRLLQRAQRAIHGNLATSWITAALQQDTAQVMQSGYAQTRTYTFTEGVAEVLIETESLWVLKCILTNVSGSRDCNVNWRVRTEPTRSRDAPGIPGIEKRPNSNCKEPLPT
jgi:xanthine dehydrogenase accessory factor